MRTIFTIAFNSFREFLRDRVVFICGFVAVFLFGMSFLLGALSFAEQVRILAHIGLLAVYVVFAAKFFSKKTVQAQKLHLGFAGGALLAAILVGYFQT